MNSFSIGYNIFYRLKPPPLAMHLRFKLPWKPEFEDDFEVHTYRSVSHRSINTTWLRFCVLF